MTVARGGITSLNTNKHEDESVSHRVTTRVEEENPQTVVTVSDNQTRLRTAALHTTL